MPPVLPKTFLSAFEKGVAFGIVWTTSLTAASFHNGTECVNEYMAVFF